MSDIISKPYTKAGEETYERVFGKREVDACPLCNGKKVKPLGLVKTPMGRLSMSECESCKEQFTVNE